MIGLKITIIINFLNFFILPLGSPKLKKCLKNNISNKAKENLRNLIIKEVFVSYFVITLCNIYQNKYCLKILKILNYSVGNYCKDFVDYD